MPESPITARLAKLRQHRTAPLILELDLTEGITETRPTDPISAIYGEEQARHCPTYSTACAEPATTTGSPSSSRASAASPSASRRCRNCAAPSLEFADAGKTTIAWAESFGEFSASNVQYYLATAFEKIWLQPSGDLGLTGIAVERIFLRGVLDKARRGLPGRQAA